MFARHCIWASARSFTRRGKIGIIDQFSNHVDTRRHGSSSTHQDDCYSQAEAHRACNDQYHGIVNIRESISGKGLGVFASKAFAVGDLVLSSKQIEEATKRDSHTVQIDQERHIIMDMPSILVNHSCDPNMGVKDNKKDGNESSYEFLAIRPIEQGEELTWDYETTEWELSASFACKCGVDRCRGILSGFKDNGDAIRKLYGEHLANYLKM
mmetsp:Transcript_17061/g.39195  ORF Transcript_17061/g.39195 Transcript_17061/m.39195 type:complete len:211 (-) Transcript_17061:2342-2974(-)